jgi:hypothetical protein
MKFTHTNKSTRLLTIQTVYYSITALWPLIHMDSFLYISGYKTDLWLVETVSVLLLAISCSFIVAIKNGIGPSVITLAFTSALVLMYIDIYYVSINRISEVYLADAFIEFCILTAWTLLVMKRRTT